MRAHYKKYVIHMSLTHFYPVHQNSVFILNVKMPFMSLYMSPFKLLFLNDIGTCFGSFKILFLNSNYISPQKMLLYVAEKAYGIL